MSVAVAACTMAQHGTTAAVSGANVTIGAADATNPRFDLVSADNTGALVVTAGTPASSPLPPTIPTSGGKNNAVLCAVYVPAGDTAITATQITDKRACIPAAGAGSGDVTHTGALTANAPVIGNGVDDLKVTTAAIARSSTVLNVDGATARGNSNYTILPTDRLVYTSAAFTAPRVWTLPAANAVNVGQKLCILDPQATVTASNTLTLARAGADTLDGVTSYIIDRPLVTFCVYSDGTSKWFSTGVSLYTSGTPGTGTIATWASSATLQGQTTTAVLDGLGSTQGSILYRNASAWVPLTPGTSGHFLKTLGAGGNPTWDAPSGSGTVTATAGALTANLPVVGNGSTDLKTVTAAVARTSTHLNIDQATAHGDTNYTIVATDRRVYTSAAFTATRTWTLPAASAVNAGQELCIYDQVGTLTSTNRLTVVRAGSDTINGTASFDLATAYSGACLTSDGGSAWTRVVGNIAGSGVLTTSTLPKATGAASVADSCVSDDGATVTATCTNGVHAPGFTGTGAGIGVVGGAEGTLPSAAAAGQWKLAMSDSDHKLYASTDTAAFAKVMSGTTTGNTTTFVTATGSTPSGNCVKWDANGNAVDHGSACGGAGGAATVTTFAPFPGASNATGVTVNSLTTRVATYFNLPYSMTLNQIAVYFTAAGTPGTMKVCLYSASGATKHYDGTMTPAVATAVAVSPSSVALSAGGYYMVFGCATTCSVALDQTPTSSGDSALMGVNVGSKTVWHGTVVHASGVCDATLGSVTGTNTGHVKLRLDQ